MDVEKNLKMYFQQQIDMIPGDIDFSTIKTDNMKISKRNYIPTKLALVMVLLVSLTGTTIVYGKSILTYIKNLDFYNSNGDVTWSIDTEADNGSYKDIVNETYDQLDLAPGQAVAIFAADDNPDNIIVSQQEPLVFLDINELNSYKYDSLDYVFVPELLQKNKFREGKVAFNPILPNSYFDLMIDEAKTTGKSVIVKELETSSNVASIIVEYYNKDHSEESPAFTVQIVKWFGDKVIQTNDEDGMPANNYEKIMLDESEALYTKLSGQKKISWVTSGFHYIISSTQETMTKDELLSITKALALK